MIAFLRDLFGLDKPKRIPMVKMPIVSQSCWMTPLYGRIQVKEVMSYIMSFYVDGVYVCISIENFKAMNPIPILHGDWEKYVMFKQAVRETEG